MIKLKFIKLSPTILNHNFGIIVLLHYYSISISTGTALRYGTAYTARGIYVYVCCVCIYITDIIIIIIYYYIY